MITENLPVLKIHKMTEAQFKREKEAGRTEENALYLTPDEDIDLSVYATTEQLNENVENVKSYVDTKITEWVGDIDGGTW